MRKKEIARILSPFIVSNGTNPFELKDSVADVMWRHVGIRNEKDLTMGLEKLGRIRLDSKNVQARGSRAFNQPWEACLSLWNIFLDCDAINRSAIECHESRGAHTRSDYPAKDDTKWLVNIVTKMLDGKNDPRSARPVPKMPIELERLLEK